jgi:hypothetical protein
MPARRHHDNRGSCLTHRRPLGVPCDRACNVISDTVHETITQVLAAELKGQLLEKGLP